MKLAATLLFVLIALLIAPTAASSAGLNLGWAGGTPASACPGAPTALADAVDACDNASFHLLVGSVVAPEGLSAVAGERFEVEFVPATPILPDFWHLEAGGCRDGSLAAAVIFTGFATTLCRNYWGNSAAGAWQWRPDYPQFHYAVLVGDYARDAAGAGPMTAGTQYYVFRAYLDDLRSFDDGTGPVCGGCMVPGCFAFERLTLYQPPGVGDIVITSAATRPWVTWQSGAGTHCPPGCTPAQRPSWGRMKSLYR